MISMPRCIRGLAVVSTARFENKHSYILIGFGVACCVREVLKILRT